MERSGPLRCASLDRLSQVGGHQIAGVLVDELPSWRHVVVPERQHGVPEGGMRIGWLDVPLICTHEVNVPGSLVRCVRILLHWNTDKQQNEITHVYTKEASRLRPDLSELPPVDLEELDRWIAEQTSQFED